PNTKDDFVLTLKELELPDGRRLPYWVWLSGDYPGDFAGLCKLLSLDMRIIDPAWIGAKLSKLLTYSEPMGEFFAPVPGEQRQKTWPSTVAYMAALMLHRYAVLGILAADGAPAVPVGVLESPATQVASVASPAETTDKATSTASQAVAGSACPDCGALAVIKHDGCKMCSNCGWQGDCG
ncbi:MAG: hypothetical protein L0H29_00940, partial [Sinobacteraceae bacterium]|nr:hypothetical protein [Nevskiaceae bacterium]